MYTAEDVLLLEVEFACKPFNDLSWALWKCFSIYHGSRQVARTKGEPGEQVYNKTHTI